MKPSIGRIVHFVDPSGAHLPAIITCVHSDTCVNLKVFRDAEGDSFITSVVLNDEGGSSSWHWPERDGE